MTNLSAPAMSTLVLKSKDYVEFYQEVLIRDGIFPFRVTGISMFPALKAGDTILVRQCRPEQLVHGDIVVFHRNSDQLVAHRIIGTPDNHGTEFLKIRGDTCFHTETVSPNDVIGKVLAVRRNGRLLPSPKLKSEIVLVGIAVLLMFYRLSSNFVRNSLKIVRAILAKFIRLSS